MTNTDVMENYFDIIKEFRIFKPRAIALWGSYGMGFQDKFSHDIDIVVYVDQLPSKRIRGHTFSALSDGSIPQISLPYDANFFPRKNEICEVVFKLCSDMESRVLGLLEGQRNCEKDVAMYIYYTKALYDDGWLAMQKKKVQKYPKRLLKANLFSSLFSALRQIHYYDRGLNKRKQPYWAELCINEGLDSLIHALFAANKRYYGKSKWAEVQYRNFRIKPKNFERRIVSVMKSRDIGSYKRLALDVCAMCKKYYPNECANVVDIDSKLLKIDDYIESKKGRIRFYSI